MTFTIFYRRSHKKWGLYLLLTSIDTQEMICSGKGTRLFTRFSVEYKSDSGSSVDMQKRQIRFERSSNSRSFSSAIVMSAIVPSITPYQVEAPRCSNNTQKHVQILEVSFNEGLLNFLNKFLWIFAFCKSRLVVWW